MSSREEIIIKLYNNYRFIEEDFSEFRKIPCLSDVKKFKEGATKLSYYVLEEVKNKGFVETFTKVEKSVVTTEDKTATDTAFLVLQLMCEVTGYHVKDKDINKLANSEEYRGCFNAFLSQNFITDINNLNEKIYIDLLKRVLTVRLEAIESEKKVNLYPGKLISEIVSVPKDKLDEYIEGLPEDDKRVIREREEAIKENNSKEIPMSDSIKFDQIVKKMKRELIYDEKASRTIRKASITSIYKMSYGKERIKKAISTLPPEQQDLIKKREEGYPLSDEERQKFNDIKNKIIKIIDKEMQEEKKAQISSGKQMKKTIQQTPTINRNPSAEKQKSVSYNVILGAQQATIPVSNEEKEKELDPTNESIIERVKQIVGESLSIDDEKAELIIKRLPNDVISLLGKEAKGEELSVGENDRISNEIQATMNTCVAEIMHGAKNWDNVIPEVAKNKSNNNINEKNNNKQPEEKLTIESIVERIKQKIGETLSIDEETVKSIMDRLPDDVIVLLGKEVIGQELSPKEYDRVSNAIQITMNTRVTEVMQSARNWKNIITEGATGNKYYVVAYKSINADDSLIDREIAKLPAQKKELIERTGKISEGVFEKLLTPEENNNLQSTFNKIRSNLGLETIPQEKPKIISKTVVRRHKDTASLARMSPEEWAAVLEKLSDNDKRIIKAKEEGKELNLVDKNRYAYLVNSLKKGIIPKERLKKASIYEEVPYPKEELDKLIEKLSDNDKRIIKEKEEGNKLNRTDNHRYYYLKKCLKEGNIPEEHLKKTSIYEDTPYSKEELDKLIEKLSDNDKRIIKEKEEGNKLNSIDNHRYNYLKKCLKKGIIPVRGRKKDSTTPTKEDKKVKEKNTRIGNRKSIYQIPFSKELIDAAIDKLSQEQQELIKRKERGDQLTKNEIRRANNLARSIKIKLEKEEKTPISNKQLQKELSLYEEPINDDQTSKEEEKKEESPQPKKRGGQRKELHEFFPGWSEEKIERSMEQLSDEDKAIVEARNKNQEMSTEDEHHLYYIIRMLKQGKIPGKKKRDVIKTTSYDEDEIKARAHEAYKVIGADKNQFSEKNKKEKPPISNAQLHEELSVPIEKPSMITIGINQVLSSGKESKEYPVPQTIPIQTSKEGNDKLSTDYKRTLAEASNNPIVIEEIDMTDIYMTGIRYGFLNGYPKKSIDEIAEWFGKTPDEVERITDEVLEKLYYVIVNNFKNTKQSDEKIFVKTEGETGEE